MANLLRKKPFFTILAAVWLVFAVVFAGVFVIVEHNHQHVDMRGHMVPTGENCQICYKIQIALMLIEAACRLGLCIAVMGILANLLSFVRPQRVFCPFYTNVLTVKFNC